MKSMRIFFFILIHYVYFANCKIGKKISTDLITCQEFKELSIVSKIIVDLSSKEAEIVTVQFFISTHKNRKPIQIDLGDQKSQRIILKKLKFNPSHKTIILIHGFLSDANVEWMQTLNDKLHDAKDVNIIMVDWGEIETKKNYANAARSTLRVSHIVANFMQNLISSVKRLLAGIKDIQWNRLYFIGHSLGAHISGQTAHFLHQDSFWKIERITGLDPAKPCFEGIESFLRLDKKDADFVDIIHTSTGLGGADDGLGLVESLGHTDIYVNGGITQPGCSGSVLNMLKMICSHGLSHQYFIESVKNLKTGKVQLSTYPWNGSFKEAKTALEKQLKYEKCNECPQFGIKASKNQKTGNFIIFTSSVQPYFELNKVDLQEYHPTFITPEEVDTENLKTHITKYLKGNRMAFLTSRDN